MALYTVRSVIFRVSEECACCEQFCALPSMKGAPDKLFQETLAGRLAENAASCGGAARWEYLVRSVSRCYGQARTPRDNARRELSTKAPILSIGIATLAERYLNFRELPPIAFIALILWIFSPRNADAIDHIFSLAF